MRQQCYLGRLRPNMPSPVKHKLHAYSVRWTQVQMAPLSVECLPFCAMLVPRCIPQSHLVVEHHGGEADGVVCTLTHLLSMAEGATCRGPCCPRA